MARRCAAMCFLMAGCADRSLGLRSYRRVRGFTCIVPGDASHIARNRSTAIRVIFCERVNPAPSSPDGSSTEAIP